MQHKIPLGRPPNSLWNTTLRFCWEHTTIMKILVTNFNDWVLNKWERISKNWRKFGFISYQRTKTSLHFAKNVMVGEILIHLWALFLHKIFGIFLIFGNFDNFRCAEASRSCGMLFLRGSKLFFICMVRFILESQFQLWSWFSRTPTFQEELKKNLVFHASTTTFPYAWRLRSKLGKEKFWRLWRRYFFNFEVGFDRGHIGLPFPIFWSAGRCLKFS